MENLHKLEMRASVSENTLFCTCAAHANFLPASVFHLHRENRQKEEKIAQKTTVEKILDITDKSTMGGRRRQGLYVVFVVLN